MTCCFEIMMDVVARYLPCRLIGFTPVASITAKSWKPPKFTVVNL
jgi:hypothetical protein